MVRMVMKKMMMKKEEEEEERQTLSWASDLVFT